jgi:hypothetical protein
VLDWGDVVKGVCSRAVLNQCTHDRVASSRSSTLRKGQSWRTHSVLYSPITVVKLTFSLRTLLLPEKCSPASVRTVQEMHHDRGGDGREHTGAHAALPP